MSPAPATPLSELPSELFLVISSHLFIVIRPYFRWHSLHRLNEVVIPCLLYNAVRVEGEEQALRTLNMLTAKAASVNEEDIQKKGNPSLSHYIHYLCIDNSVTTPILTSDRFINALQKLIDVDGLRHLSDLSLHIDDVWWPTVDSDTNTYLSLSLLFLERLRKKCPLLKNVYLSRFSQEFGNKWIEAELFSIKVYNRL